MVDPIETAIVNARVDRSLEIHRAKVIAINTTTKIATIRPGGSDSALDDIESKYAKDTTMTVGTYVWFILDNGDRLIFAVTP